MRTIAIEEHCATEAFMEGPGRELKAQAEAARIILGWRRATTGSCGGCATLARAGSRRWRRRASMCRCCR